MTTRFGAGQFFPERTLRLWRNIVLLCSLVYSGILAYVVTKEFVDRTAAHVAASLACKIYVLYSAAVLLLLALSFLISGRARSYAERLKQVFREAVPNHDVCVQCRNDSAASSTSRAYVLLPVS
jgi:TRAP-type C4-dicarboxylate transport system permease small subunit